MFLAMLFLNGVAKSTGIPIRLPVDRAPGVSKSTGFPIRSIYCVGIAQYICSDHSQYILLWEVCNMRRIISMKSVYVFEN